MKIQKGEYGFLKKQKKRFILKMILCVAGGLVMFGAGYLVNKGNPKNICSVLALLMALPLSKAFTELVVVFPFQDVEKSRYDKVAALCPKHATLLTGLVITSEKRSMNLDFLVECDGNVIGLAGRKEADLPYVNEYLTKGIRNWGYNYQVRIMKEEKAFLNAVQSITPYEMTEQEQKNVLSYIKSLIVQ